MTGTCIHRTGRFEPAPGPDATHCNPAKKPAWRANAAEPARAEVCPWSPPRDGGRGPHHDRVGKLGATGHDAWVKDWVAWHALYDDPSSSLSARLERVQAHLAAAVDQAPAGRVSLVSLCAGQGRDVIGVLPDHPRRADVHGVLVESDAHNASLARQAAAGRGLSQIEVRQADASLVAGFADALPADVLLLCGIFGNVSDRDIKRTVHAVPALCRDGATVIWTRHRRAPDLTPQVRAWFAEIGCAEIAFDALGTSALTSVGVNRVSRPAAGRLPAHPLFTFRAA